MSIEGQIANGATGTAAVAGTAGASLSIAGVIESNSTIIIIGCTFASLIVAVIFHRLNYKVNRDRLRIQMADKIDEWIKEGKTHDEIERLLKLAKDFR